MVTFHKKGNRLAANKAFGVDRPMPKENPYAMAQKAGGKELGLAISCRARE